MNATYVSGKPHLWDIPPKNNHGWGKYDTLGEHEARCTVEGCHARVTVDPDDGTEYGHQYGCPHRSDDLPRSGADVGTCDGALLCSVCGRGDFKTRSDALDHEVGEHDREAVEFPSRVEVASDGGVAGD